MLTFYDDATGERTELSAATLGNWAAKTANFVVDEVGGGARRCGRRRPAAALADGGHLARLLVGRCACPVRCGEADDAVAVFTSVGRLDDHDDADGSSSPRSTRSPCPYVIWRPASPTSPPRSGSRRQLRRTGARRRNPERRLHRRCWPRPRLRPIPTELPGTGASTAAGPTLMRSPATCCPCNLGASALVSVANADPDATDRQRRRRRATLSQADLVLLIRWSCVKGYSR